MEVKAGAINSGIWDVKLGQGLADMIPNWSYKANSSMPEEIAGRISLVRMAWEFVTPRNITTFVLALVLARFISLAIYRLYLHPLAKFPGPKLAALTRLYEFYYQGILITDFPAEIQRMHEKYGPVVRISPEELSINDSKFNIEYFMHDRKLEKDTWYYTFGFTNSLFTLLDKKKHRSRQEHLAAHFSGSYFQKAFPMMTEEVGSMRHVLQQHAENGDSVN
ncbi:hypothetical protein Golomagni_06663, partial [Golovinomyces magnicellulatus]